MKFVIAAVLSGFALLQAHPASAEAWSDAQVADLVQSANDMPHEGLAVPSDELALLAVFDQLRGLDPSFEETRNAVATSLFALLALDYARGGVDPAAVGADWNIALPSPPDMAHLASALSGGASPSALLQTLAPQTGEYRALRIELARLNGEPQSDEVTQRIDQVRANLERWRWLPRDMPQRRIEVRIAQFELIFYRPDAAPLHHAVIVGAPRSPSPIFDASVVSVTVNPSWTPPSTIVSNELLPRFRRDHAAAAREGFDVIDAAGNVVAPEAVAWDARPFPYQLRQRPGAANALGRLRFDLPNRFAVYLHDTPSRSLFERTNRALSHGCIRVQNPVQLAAAVFETPDWDEPALQAAIDTGEMQSIPLTTPTPVYVLYLTTALQDDGSIAYLSDLYHRDAAIVRALDAPRVEAALSSDSARRCAP